MEWDGTRSDDGGGVGGVALGWVFTVEGGAWVCVHQDGRGVMWGGRNESGWVGIGESLTFRDLGEPLSSFRAHGICPSRVLDNMDPKGSTNG